MNNEYSTLANTPKGFRLTGIPHVKKGQVFLWEGEEGLFRAKKDAFLENGTWCIEVEDEDFNTKHITYKKGDLAYAPKLYIEIK